MSKLLLRALAICEQGLLALVIFHPEPVVFVGGLLVGGQVGDCGRKLSRVVQLQGGPAEACSAPDPALVHSRPQRVVRPPCFPQPVQTVRRPVHGGVAEAVGRKWFVFRRVSSGGRISCGGVWVNRDGRVAQTLPLLGLFKLSARHSHRGKL